MLSLFIGMISAPSAAATAAMATKATAAGTSAETAGSAGAAAAVAAKTASKSAGAMGTAESTGAWAGTTMGRTRSGAGMTVMPAPVHARTSKPEYWPDAAGIAPAAHTAEMTGGNENPYNCKEEYKRQNTAETHSSFNIMGGFIVFVFM